MKEAGLSALRQTKGNVTTDHAPLLTPERQKPYNKEAHIPLSGMKMAAADAYILPMKLARYILLGTNEDP